MNIVLGIIISALTLCFLVFSALLTVMIRVITRYTRTESKLDVVAEDLKDLILSKDRIHAELVAQINRDRDATDRRLRYLEEWHMKHE